MVRQRQTTTKSDLQNALKTPLATTFESINYSTLTETAGIKSVGPFYLHYVDDMFEQMKMDMMQELTFFC